MIVAGVELQRDISTKGVKEVLVHPLLRPGLYSQNSGPRDRVAYQISKRSNSRDQLAEGVQYISGQIHVPAFKEGVRSRRSSGNLHRDYVRTTHEACQILSISELAKD
jgi:hypothetical protein